MSYYNQRCTIDDIERCMWHFGHYDDSCEIQIIKALAKTCHCKKMVHDGRFLKTVCCGEVVGRDTHEWCVCVRANDAVDAMDHMHRYNEFFTLGLPKGVDAEVAGFLTDVYQFRHPSISTVLFTKVFNSQLLTSPFHMMQNDWRCRHVSMTQGEMDDAREFSFDGKFLSNMRRSRT
jgi:hypothetical protein